MGVWQEQGIKVWQALEKKREAITCAEKGEGLYTRRQGSGTTAVIAVTKICS